MIYLDYAATTPIDPRVLKVMEPYLKEHFGNASSIHQFGQKTRQAIDEARNQILSLLGAFSPKEIIFTGSGTESCNMAIFGAAFAGLQGQKVKKHLVISGLEHPAVREAAEHLKEFFGFELTVVNPDAQGLLDPKKIEKALREDTSLVSVMLVNNEVGTIQPIKKIAKICRKRGILFHTDACQAPGYTDINVAHLGVDLMTLNGSKLYGPKGIGLLYIREGVQILPLIHGGGQEFRMRGGTESTALIVGFAKALELVIKEYRDYTARASMLRDDLLKTLLEIPGISLNGDSEHRTPNNLNLHVPGVSGESMVMRLDLEGIAVSSGSACSSGKAVPSKTLLAMGQNFSKAMQSLRITLGKFTTAEEVEIAKKTIKKILLELKSI